MNRHPMIAPALILASILGASGSARPGPVDAPEAGDEARERKVMERFLAVLEKAPRRGTALDRVYGYHVERGSLDGFAKTYRDRVAADPADGASWLLLGLVEAQRGRDAAAVEALRKAEATRPDDPMPPYYLGQALVLVGQPDEAAGAFERALSRKPTRADLLDIYQALGRVHQRARRNDRALAVWDRLERAFPDDPRVQEQIAHALADEGQDAPALARFEALAKGTRDKFRQVQFAIEAAELKVRLGQSAEALADFETLLGKLDPESWLSREVRRKVEEVFLRTDDLAGLAAYYERWIQKTPDDVEAMARLGRSLASQGRAAEARKWLDQAVKLAPSRRELRTALIEQLVQDRQFTQAAAQYEALARAEPNNPDVVRDWGRMLLRDTSRPEADRKVAAAKVWRRLAPDDARDAVAVAQAADLFRQAGLTDDAIDLYDRAIELAPEASQYREYLGEYYHTLKRPADALATWRATAAGANRNARSLGRLGEVLAGFGYRAEAAEPLTEACRLEPDDFDLRLKLADLRLAMDRPAEALPDLEKAETLAAAEEQSEAVVDRLIRAYQSSGSLAARSEGLRKELAAKPTAAGWTRLARLLEAEGKAPEAARAIGEATRIDPKSVPAWVATARLREAAGDLLGSVEALRTLTNLDRRSRTDYLTGIAKLEARLGRKGPALEAGRELLAAAPGNPDHHQFFAELCFGLGELDEGLDALRRAARANPTDPKAMLTLAENLARQFRAEEAIELYWRAFARTPDSEGKLSIVARMADQYLQRNQLDRLIGRLERELREPDKARELSLCLAQAHAASGDFGTARLELERLLTANARDAPLLGQLSGLAEQEGDLSSSAKYQKQAVEIAPTPEGTARLAQLYLRAGEMTEAETVWSRLAAENNDPARVLAAVDNLLSHGKHDSVLAITERLLLKEPGDWEALYREGVALDALGKPADAARRFRAILGLKRPDDEPGALVKSRQKNPNAPTAGQPATATAASARRAATSASFPIQGRINAAWQIRSAARLDTTRYYSGGGQPTTWTPPEFGQARMAALGWLYAIASREQKEADFLKLAREAVAKAGADPRARWDFYYLQLDRADEPAVFEAALGLVKALPADASAEYAFLSSLPSRGEAKPSSVRSPSNEEAVDRTPPLPAEDLERVMASYRDFHRKRPDYAPSLLMGTVATELKRARRDDEAETFYREALAASDGVASVDAAITLVAEKGSVDDLLTLQDRSDRLRAGNPAATSANTSPEHPDAFARVMNHRAGARAYGDVARLLDRYLAAVRAPEAVARRARAKNSAGTSGRSNYAILVGKAHKYVNLDYPTPNAYFDFAAIQVLRNAFELYKRDDLLSDLTAHLKAEADRLPEGEKVYPTLALGYLAWWSDDKDEAVRHLTRAVELAGGDVDLRLGVAEIQAKRGEPAEALELVDAVEPLDQKTVQRREILALRLAVLAGDVDRARKASERLFGLRLDAETQVQLAAQMNQLGMHDLAEAVLARARRRAGGNTSALVALMLQYQQQGKTEVAFQVANQVLRASSHKPFSPNNNNDPDESSRREAIQVFARSGKLKELIERAETQLKAAPNSVQALQSLADYYKADGQAEKVKATYNRLAALRPDDARLRYQIATQMLQSGDAEGAVAHFAAAIRKEPALYSNRYWEIQNAFQQAGKMEELGRAFEDVDLKAFSNNPYGIQQIVASLTQDEKTRDLGMKLFRRAWKAFPESRTNMLGNMEGDTVWQLPEIYDNLREAVIPAPGRASIAPWEAIDQIQSYNGDGKVTGVVSRLLEGAAKQKKLDALEKEVDEGIRKFPEWSGGRALKAIILVRRGKAEQARPILEDLLARDKEIPSSARMIVGQELTDSKPLAEVELKFYEGAVEDDDNGMDYQWGPAKRLVTLYHKAGKDAQARDLVLKNARKPSDRNYGPGNQGYAAYQKLQNNLAFGQQMVELGYPADAVRFFDEILGDAEGLAASRQWNGNQDQMTQQATQGMDAALKALTPENLAKTLRALVPPPAETGKGPTPPVDLALIVQPKELDKAAVTSLLARTLGAPRRGGKNGLLDLLGAVRSGTKIEDPRFLGEVKAVLARRAEADPKDLSTAIATALVAAAEDDSPGLTRASDRLVELVEAAPLDAVSPGSRPNARQRAEAAGQIGLWLVARECLKHEPTRKAGATLEARALEAARRQPDARWTLAMLREGGQAALDRGDRAAAESAWRQMLRQVLAPPSLPKARKPPEPARPKVTTRPRGLVAAILTVAQVPAPAPASVPVPVPKPPAAAVATLERFEQAAQIALLAASHEMHDLSAEAIRESLGAGPPVVPIALEAAVVRRARRQDGEPSDPSAQEVEERIHGLDAAWTRHGMPAGLAYETLLGAVLPEARPGEVFLYPRPLSLGEVEHPRSVGAILVRRAVQAGRLDDLRKRVEERRDRPMAAVPAQVLAVQVAIASKDDALATRLISGLADRLQKDALQNTAELACHAAIPALDVPGAAGVALPMVEAAAKAMTNPNGQSSLGPLLLAVARRKFKEMKPDDARLTLKTYVEKMQESSARYGGDYSLYFRKQTLATVAAEFARAGQLADAWEILGQFADAPTSRDYGADPEVGAVLGRSLRMVAALPAAERYALLRAWSLPTAARKSIRSLATFAPEDPALPARFGPMPYRELGGVAATSTLLVEAARQANKLDELIDEARAAAGAKVENARPLLTLALIAAGRSAEAEPAIIARLDELKKFAVRPEGTPRYPNEPRRGFEWTDYLVARAALADPAIGETAVRLSAALIAQAETHQNWMFLGRLRRDLVVRRAARAGTLAAPAGPDPGLASWRPATLQGADTHRQGSMATLWVESEGTVSHVAGPQAEYLLFGLPLAGTFEISADAFLGNWAEGQLGFGGLVFEPDGGGSVFPVGHHETKPVPSRFARSGKFNHITIQSDPKQLRVSVNGHLFYEEADPSPTSPWQAFHASRERQTAFRNLAISGSPEIPREVRLTHADRLEGWACGFYGETQPPRRSVGQREDQGNGRFTVTAVGDLGDYDWHAQDGAILGRRAESPLPTGGVLPSRIFHHRPLRDGESIAYEFLYEPGKTMAHPSLERLAFLIEPEGVKLRWLTDGGEDDWTGLAIDNAVEAPEARRGTGPLPLKENDWNRASITLEGGKALLDLNGVRVFEVPLEPGNQRIFGFYHDKARTAAKVRAVVLRGDWPTTLPAHLLARRDPSPAPADRRARHAMVEERFALLDSGTILAEARKLPPDRRYDFLAAHVLPGPDHPSFRIQGEFSPTDPADSAGAPATGARLASGGVLESPAAELVATAREAGKLDELAARVEKAQPRPSTRRSVAMLALVRLGQGRDGDAEVTLRNLYPHLAKVADDEPESGRWPELVVASAAIERLATRRSALGLLDLMDQQWKKKYLMEWAKYVRATRSRAALLDKAGIDPKVPGWAPVAISAAHAMGRGQPFPTWTFANGAWSHHPGHHHDHLFLTSPLLGDFAVEAELSSFDWRETQLSYGSVTVAIEYNKKSYSLRHYGHFVSTNPINPPLGDIPPWYLFRLEVKDGTLRAFVEGRLVHERKLPDEPDPWLAIGTYGETMGGARNLRISGKPVIPGSIPLSARPDLTGWVTYYGDGDLWRKSGDEIVGLKLRDPNEPANPSAEAWPAGIPGSRQESVLKYVRPMLEDGDITYEFFYETGRAMVHPALGRLAFLIEPDGLKLHRMTDAQHDRTGLKSDNAAVEPDRRRGPSSPPLRPGAWNKLRLSTAGDVVTVALNDVVVYERPIESTNQRDFGLFRYADESEARVRNVHYRGDWPRTIPPGLLAAPDAEPKPR